MENSNDNKIRVRINKIQENGCYCSFLPLWQNQFGFMPNRLMPSLFDENGNFTKSVGDNVEVAIYNINDKGFITLSDITTYEKEQDKLRKKEEKAIMKQRVESFASSHECGTKFEAEVIRVQNSKVIIQVGDIQGVIKKEDTNWNEIDRLEDLLFDGEIINVVYIKHENDQLYFSLKLLNDKPYDDNLYDLSLSDLLKYAGHDSNVFIGQVIQSGKFAFVENLYSCDELHKGQLLIDPIYGYNLKAVVVNSYDNQVVDGDYYEIKLTNIVDRKKRLERSQLFQFTAEIIGKVDNPYKSDVKKAFSWHDSPASNSSLANILNTVGLEMYSSAERMFFELIQNADDAASQAGVNINIDQKDNYLIFTHNGLHFSYKDFESLVSAAKSTKSSKEKTGYKGIGFKSVFTNSQQVFVDSGGYHFKFDKGELLFEDFDKFYSIVRNISGEHEMSQFIEKYATQRDNFSGVKDIPWQLLPIWYDAVPDSLKKSAFAKNQKVSFALNIKNQKIEDYIKAIEFLFDNPKFILFLRHTNRIDLKFANKTITKDIKDGIVTIKNSFASKRTEKLIKKDFEDIPVSNEAFEDKGIDIQIKEITNRQGEKENKFYDNNHQELEDIPDRIASSQTTTISFVANYNDGNITESKGNSLYAYLPMNEHRFPFPFYINGDFVLHANRETLLDNPWNYYLMANIGELLVKWVAELSKKGEHNCLKLLPLQYFDDSTLDVEQLAQSFNSAYRTALESEAFILNHKGELARQNEIIIDKTGLSEIIGADLFCKLLETEKCLPSEKIDSKILEEDIFEHIETLKFDDVIGAITDNEDFNEWFVSATDEQKKTLYRWIDKNNNEKRENDLRSFVSNLPLFQFGEEYKSCKETETTDYIITTEHIAPVKDVLSKLGFVCSDNVFDKNHPIYKFVKQQNEGDLFNSIVDRDFSELTIDERKSLFFALRGFKCVEEKLKKDIAIFKNVNGIFKPLGEMFAYRENIPAWLYEYVLSKEDYDADLANYLISQEDEFEEVIWKHRDEFGVAVTDLYGEYPWTDEKYTQQLISQHKANDNSYKQLLPIIEKSGENTKRLYLQNIERMDLTSGEEKYKKDSYKYRILQLALSVYSEPSEFSSKIYFDGRCVKDFSVSDDVVCDFYQNGETKKVKMSLAKLLPQYQDQSSSKDEIKALFESKKDLDKFFTEKSKSVYDVHRELNQHLGIPEAYFSEWNVDGNAQQFLFATYYRRQKKGWNNRYVPKIDLNKETDDFVYELLDFLFDNGISVEESPFTYHLKNCFIDKYFDSDYVSEDEQLLPIIEKWADDEKKIKYLKDNGVQTSNCNAIQFRKLFLEDKPINFIDKLSDEEINSGIEFIATANDFERPFVGEYQKNILLSLKDKCKDLTDHWDNKKMEENSIEWDTKEYKEWIEDRIPRIFIYPGILPSQLSYKNEILLNYEDSESHYYYNSQEKKLFVSDARKIEDILLFEVVKDGKCGFGLDDYKFLCSDGKVSLTQEDKDDYDNLKKEKEKIKKALQKKGLDYDDLLKGIEENQIKQPLPIHAEEYIKSLRGQGFEVFKPSEKLTQAQETYNDTYQGDIYSRDGVTIKDQIEIHKEAMNAAKKYLESKNFDFSKSDYVHSSDEFDKYQKWRSACQIHNVVQKSDGKSVTVVVKSCKGGHIYLSATDFQALTESKDNILILYDNKGCHSVSYEKLFAKGSDVNLIFDTEYTPHHYYAALGKIFTYIKRSTFAVKNPQYDIIDDIKGFGIDSETQGLQNEFDDNNL